MSVTTQISDRDHGLSSLVRMIDPRGYVDVGITANVASKPHERAVKNEGKGTESKASAELAEGPASPPTIVEIAAWHEFGTTDDGGHLPSRSWLRRWFEERPQEIQGFARRVARGLLEKKLTNKQALAAVGAWAVGDMKKRITKGIDPPLAESTLRRKKGKTTPLIDKGIFLGSIQFVSGIAKGGAP